MKRSIALLILLITPLCAFAHATPVEYIPGESSVLATMPSEAVIRFSERIEPSASTIVIFAPDGTRSQPSGAIVHADDAHIFSRTLESRGDGVYTASWQVVSADDGHFTKGAFSFIVGSSTRELPEAPSVAMVHSSGYDEAAAIWLKLVGESLLIALLVFLMLMGKCVVTETFRAELLRSTRRTFLLAGALLIGGGIAYLIVKMRLLVSAQGITFLDAFIPIIKTTAGEMTLLLIIATKAFFLVGRNLPERLLLRRSIGISGWCALLLLAAISYSQARLSHAAASDILPVFSVVVNMIHLFGKGLWVGGLLVMVLVAFPALARSREEASLRGVVREQFGYMIAAALFLGGVSGAWIVWLHLKGFMNILTTPWGAVFILLVSFAGVMFVLRMIAILFLDRYARCLNCERSWLTLEALFGLCVSFASALIIITSPPLTHAPLWSLESRSSAGVVTMSDTDLAGSEFTLAVKNVSGLSVTQSSPVVTLTNTDEGIGPIVTPVKSLGDGHFTLPMSALSPRGKWQVDAAFVQKGAYDINGKFTLLHPDDIITARHFATTRTWDSFACTLAYLAILAALTAFLIAWIVRADARYARAHPETLVTDESVTFSGGQVLAVVVFVLLALSILMIRSVIVPSSAMTHQMNGMTMSGM